MATPRALKRGSPGRGGALPLGLLGLVFACCTQPSPGLVPPFDQGPKTVAGRTLAAVIAGEHHGVVRVVQPPTRCRSGTHAVPVPIVSTLPVVGKPFTVTWAIEWMQPRTTRLVAVLTSTRPLAAPVSLGPSGCWLMVHPDFVMVPQANTMLTYTGPAGALTMSLVPPAALNGTTFYMQALVAIPGVNDLGHVLSPRLEVEIGTK